MLEFLVPVAVMGMLAIYTITIYRFGYSFGRLERTVEVVTEDIKEKLDNKQEL